MNFFRLNTTSLILMTALVTLSHCNPSRSDSLSSSGLGSTPYSKLIQKNNFYESRDRDDWQAPDRVMDELVRKEIPQEQMIVADIGSGTGYFTVRLLPRFGKVIAIDVSDRWLTHLEKRVQELSSYYPRFTEKLELRKTGPSSPSLKRSEVDGVLLSNSYHHLDDRVHYLKRIRRGMKVGGRIVIVDFLEMNRPVGPPPGHGLVEPQQIRTELKQAGFAIVPTSLKLPYQTLIVGLKEGSP